MIRIDKNSVNNILVLQANDNDRTHWLIVATHVITCTEEVFIIELTLQSSRCLQFDITDGTPEDQLNAVVDFIGGDWEWDFYKQPLATQETNLDRNLATLEFSRTTKVEGEECPSMAAPSKCPDVVVDDQGNFVSVGAGATYVCDAIACDDATYENSDQSFQQNIVSGATFVADDVINVDSDGSDVPTPANIPFVATLCPAPPSGITYKRPILTGQLTSYALYDDGWQVQNGQRDYTPPTNPTHLAQLDTTATHPHLTLKTNNVFGNLFRFTGTSGGYQDFALDFFDKDGVSTTEVLAFPSDIVVCNLTGLALTRTIQDVNVADWGTGVLNAFNSSFGGETDWFLPDTSICSSVEWLDEVSLDQGGKTLSFPPFNLTSQYSLIWTSTSNTASTTAALRFGNGENRSTPKTSAIIETIYYRNHFT